MRLLRGLLPLAAVLFMACPSPPPQPLPPPPPQKKPEAPISQTACDRVCAVEVRCNKSESACRARCKPITKILSSESLDSLVTCVEKKVSPSCDNFKEVVHQCNVDATSGRDEAAAANIDLFAQAYCDRTKECGVPGVFSKSQCLGETKHLLRESPHAPFCGALRPSAVDDIVTCFKGPCETRKSPADVELDRCLDALLASAAEQP